MRKIESVEPIPGHVLYKFRVGDRVRVKLSGRTGEIVRLGRRHCGHLVRWDDPVFNVVEGRVRPSLLEPEAEEQRR